jgi:hypothetical protein
METGIDNGVELGSDVLGLFPQCAVITWLSGRRKLRLCCLLSG